MNEGPFYVYNPAGQYQSPLFVVWDEQQINIVAHALGFFRDDLHVSRVRLHPYERDRYTSMGSSGIGLPHVTCHKR